MPKTPSQADTDVELERNEIEKRTAIIFPSTLLCSEPETVVSSNGSHRRPVELFQVRVIEWRRPGSLDVSRLVHQTSSNKGHGILLGWSPVLMMDRTGQGAFFAASTQRLLHFELELFNGSRNCHLASRQLKAKICPIVESKTDCVTRVLLYCEYHE